MWKENGPFLRTNPRFSAESWDSGKRGLTLSHYVTVLDKLPPPYEFQGSHLQSEKAESHECQVPSALTDFCSFLTNDNDWDFYSNESVGILDK